MGLCSKERDVFLISLCLFEEEYKQKTVLKHLQTLNLSDCNNITNAGLRSIAALLELQHLDLTRCDNVTGVGLKRLVFGSTFSTLA